jgi:hypothetical protein
VRRRCAISAIRLGKKGISMGDVLYLNGRCSHKGCRLRVTQSSKASPQSRRGQNPWGIEISYALQLHSHDNTRMRDGTSLSVVPSGVLKYVGPNELARCASYLVQHVSRV